MYTFTAQSVEPICSQKNGKNLSYFHKISEKWLSKFACIFPRWKSQGKWTFCMCGVISTANGLQIHYSQKNINFLKMDRKVAAEKQDKSFHLIYTKTRLIFWGKSHRMSILERHTLPGSMVPMLVFLFSGIETRFGDEKQNSFLMHFSVKITFHIFDQLDHLGISNMEISARIKHRFMFGSSWTSMGYGWDLTEKHQFWKIKWKKTSYFPVKFDYF